MPSRSPRRSHLLGRRLLDALPREMEALRLRAWELPFARRRAAGCSRWRRRARRGRAGTDRDGLLGQRSGLENLRLLKTTGSAFTRFARDDATTLPERADRPLFVHMDVAWRYADLADALAEDPSRYVAPAQVRDVICAASTSSSASPSSTSCRSSGCASWNASALDEVSFAAENHTHDPVPGSEQDAERRAYTAAFPAYGLITLTLTR